MANSKPKTVRLDTEVMNELSERRNGFETPNDCIKRLLGKKPCTQEMKEPEPKEEGEDDNS